MTNEWSTSSTLFTEVKSIDYSVSQILASREILLARVGPCGCEVAGRHIILV